MLESNLTLTLVKHIKTVDGDTYACHTVDGCSWFGKTTIATSADGAKPVNSFDVRIFDKLTGHEPANGDYIVKGLIETVEKPADLKGWEHFRITAVGNNLRGILAHWRVSGQ